METFGLIVTLILFLAGSVSCDAFLTQDDTHLKLDTIQEMIKKCDNNGGLDYIEHDYDVVCKNKAEFSFERTK